MGHIVFFQAALSGMIRDPLGGTQSLWAEPHLGNAQPFGSALFTALQWLSPPKKSICKCMCWGKERE